jgi:serine/threonine protein phosphatase PrpC
LCSDGLGRHLSDIEIAKLLCVGDPESVAHKLIAHTLNRGAIDNVTVAVVDIHSQHDMETRVAAGQRNYEFAVDQDPTEPLAAS